MRPARSRRRFVGEIAGFGTSSGIRIVVGDWHQSPYGAFADVMLEEAGGRRILLAPTQEVAEFISGTYAFDDVQVAPVRLVRSATDRVLEAGAGDLRVRYALGRRTPLGRLLRLVPRRLSTSVAFAAAADPVARLLVPGVRTCGTAGGARREYYGAYDVVHLTGVSGRWRGTELGSLRPVAPPVRFGFSSAPEKPSLTRLVTTVTMLGPD